MIDGLTPLVELPLGADTWSTPLWVKDCGLIIAAARDGCVSAWRPSGERVWMRRVGNCLSASPNMASLAGLGPYVFIGSHDGWLTALAAEDGAVLWKRSLGAMVRATVAVADEQLQARPGAAASNGPQLFAASYGDHLWRIDAASGHVRWRKWLPRHVWARGRGVVSSPIVADVDADGQLEVVVGTRSWRIFCVSAEDGKLRWWRGFRYGVDSTCTVADLDGVPLLLVGTGESLYGPGDRAIVALEGDDGELRWRTELGGGIDSSATCFDSGGRTKLVQTSLADASSYCLDLATGKIDWSHRMGPTEACEHDPDNLCILKSKPGYFTDWAYCRSYATPLVGDWDGDGRTEVLVGSMNGILYCLDSARGTEKGRWETQGPVRGSPICADLDGDGQVEVIIPSGQRLLVARSRATRGDWPMFKGDPTLSGRAKAGVNPTPSPRTPHQSGVGAAHARLFLQWALRDLGYFVQTRIDKHIMNRFGCRRMTYWY